MPKTKLRHSTKSDTKQARLKATQAFLTGDRLRHRLTGKIGRFVSINKGFALPEVWVEFESDTECSVPYSCNPLDLELIQQCHDDTQSLAASVELQDCATEASGNPDLNTSSKSPNSSRQIPTAEPCLLDTSRLSDATTTSEPLVQNQDNSILWSEEVLARESVEPTLLAEDSTINAQYCGSSSCDSSGNADHNSLSGKTSAAPDTPSQVSQSQHWEEYSGVLPSAGTMQNGKLLQQPHLERPTRGNGYSLLPTPMAHSRASMEYSSPGQDKLEQKLREIGAIPPGEVSTPELREWMMGLPDGWTDTTVLDGGLTINNPQQSAPPNVASQTEQQELPPSEILVHPPKLLSYGEESQNSPIICGIDEKTSVKGLASVVTTTDNVACDSDAKNAVEIEPSSSALFDEELSPEELDDRHRLELKVERAFVESGNALKEIRDRRLYRDTHPDDFAGYCRARFDKTHRAVNYLIAAAEIYSNLMVTNGDHEDEDETGTSGSRVLPTNQRQIRDLVGLSPSKQRQVWKEAVYESGGKVPPGRIVKGVVERLHEKDTAPPLISYHVGDVVSLRGLGNPGLRKYDGQWVVVMAVNEYTVIVALDRKDISVKPQFLEPVDPKYWIEIKAVNERITRLQLERDLDPADDAVLEVLRRRCCFTSRQMMLLERMEQDYSLA